MTTWYVRDDGSNSNSGKLPREAFETLHKAYIRSQPGDKIIANGHFDEPLVVDKHGWVKIIARPGTTMDLDDDFAFGFLIKKPGVTVQGWEITGVDGSAKKHGAAITIDTGVHHTNILDNHIHGVDGEAIFAGPGADFVNIQRNHIHDVDASWSGTSAVSILRPKAMAGYANVKVGITFKDNWVHDTGSRGTADDFAFILDNNPNNHAYMRQVVVSGNLFEGNAKGVLMFNVRDFLIEDNTAIGNGYAQFAWRNSNGVVRNNVAISDDGESFTFLPRMKDSRVAFDDNAAWDSVHRDAGTPPQMPLAPAEHWTVQPLDPHEWHEWWFNL